jgi:cytochrome c553
MNPLHRSWLVALLLGTALAARSAEPARQELAKARSLQADADRGALIFRSCATCHGEDGGGTPDGSVPRIAGQHSPVLLKQLVDFRHGKRWDFRMESRADRHHLQSTQELVDVALHVSLLKPATAAGQGEGSMIAEGAALYTARCARCHGARAEGDATKNVPSLAGQHYGYLLRQMYDAVDGRRPTLQRYHVQRIEPLDFAQVRSLADFLSRESSAKAK